MTSGPVVVLCLQRENAVGRLLEVLGPSDARAAKKQSQFYLRGSFGEDAIHNAFYGRVVENWFIVCFPPGNSLLQFPAIRLLSRSLAPSALPLTFLRSFVNGIRTYDAMIPKQRFFQLSYQANWALVICEFV